MNKALTNAQLIKAIGLDKSTNPTAKYTLLICAHVCMDWRKRSAAISADDIAEASSQSSRQVKRHFKALIEAGWLQRRSEIRSKGLHHKSVTTLNIAKAQEILDGLCDVTELVKPDVTELVKPDVTELVKPDVTESVSAKNVTADVTELVSHDVTELVKPLPKMSHISIYTNNKQYNNNREEVEPELESAREDREPSNEEQQRADLWDSIMSDPKPEITEELRDGLWYVSDIYDELEYKRKIMWEINHHERQDIRRALWNHSDGDKLYTKMKHERIAPRSAIDWVGLQAAGHMPKIKTPKAPPQKPNSYTVTPDRQAEILAADQAWLNIINSKGNDEW